MIARIQQDEDKHNTSIYLYDPHPDGGSLVYGPGARTARRYEPGEAVVNVLPTFTLPRHMAARALQALAEELDRIGIHP